MCKGRVRVRVCVRVRVRVCIRVRVGDLLGVGVGVRLSLKNIAPSLHAELRWLMFFRHRLRVKTSVGTCVTSLL